MEKTVKCIFALGHSESVKRGITLAHKMLSHLTDETKKEIEQEFMLNQSFIVSFYEEYILKAVCIYTVYRDRVHIRETGGSYFWAVHHFRKYGEIAAKKLGLKYVSFYATDERIQKRAMQSGFFPDPQHENEFLKEAV